MKKIVVIYSGGMDSFTTLHKAIATGAEVHAINFFYNQKHKVEMLCAKRVCEANGIPLKVVDIGCLAELASSSALTGGCDVPKGHYEDESMKDTVVANRNMVLLSMAASFAIDIGAEELWYGAHSGDHAIYPDCRPEFVAGMQHAFMVCHYEPLKLVVPYLHGNKETILMDGFEMGLDYGDTWTCYDPQVSATDENTLGVKACGECGSCQERLEAFKALHVQDPVEYV